MKSTDIPTAMEMGEKLDYLSRLLFREQLIDYRSKSHLDKVSTQLKKRQKKTKTWEYTIHASKPIEFVPIKDKKLGQVAPFVYLDVAVAPPEKDDVPPFSRINTTIEVWDILENQLQSRWHIDLANRKADGTYQAGPLFHLQGGGHKPKGNRLDELKVSIPRWTIPPMELILTCEMIIANFYPDKWDKISEQKKWLELIRVAQQLCYSSYIERFQNSLYSGQAHSVLSALWAKEWGS
ncbi:MAG: hypothetical protein KAI83_00780 [Thiomargarita sp.]|nr:hypothetical protein [Thiomargarita sp.]